MSKHKTVRNSLAAWRGWLSPGIGVKRWLLILGVGAILMGVGIGALIVQLEQSRFTDNPLYNLVAPQFQPAGLRIVIPIVIGGALIIFAIVRLGSTLVAPFRSPNEGVAESLHSYSTRLRGPRVVAIGGGTGMPTLLRGLRPYTNDITAVVTVADDGGSSGRLRQEFGLIPPGDFRNNLAALARDEALMTQLMQYRFSGRVDEDDAREERELINKELQGHAFGNLLLAALTGVTGSFDEALAAAERVLAIRGKVLPSTLENVTLIAEVFFENDGSYQRIVGESKITEAGGRIDILNLEPANAAAYPPSVKAILNAEIVVIGPGSLFTSILPNLLVPDIAQAIKRTRALKVYVCNLATQVGETDNYDVGNHINAINKHVVSRGIDRDDWLDVVVANDNLSIPSKTGGGSTIYVKPANPLKIRMMTRDLVDEDQPWRHDSDKLARAILEIYGDHG